MSFRVLSLGLGTDGKAGYPLVAFHITGKDVKNLLEIETSVAPLKTDAHLQLSGMKLTTILTASPLTASGPS